MLSLLEMHNKLPTSGASVTTDMHADTEMDMEQLFGVYGGVISIISHPFGYPMSWNPHLGPLIPLFFSCFLPCDDFEVDVCNTSTPQEMEILNLPKDFDVSHVKARVGRDATEMPMLRVDFRWEKSGDRSRVKIQTGSHF